jgi:hypothetical protein
MCISLRSRLRQLDVLFLILFLLAFDTYMWSSTFQYQRKAIPPIAIPVSHHLDACNQIETVSLQLRSSDYQVRRDPVSSSARMTVYTLGLRKGKFASFLVSLTRYKIKSHQAVGSPSTIPSTRSVANSGNLRTRFSQVGYSGV